MMTLGSILAAVAMVTVAWSPILAWFVVAWLLAGVAMSGVLYPPALAALTRWYGARRVAALTVLTLAGGLASTIFAPITALLAGQLGDAVRFYKIGLELLVKCACQKVAEPWFE